MSFVTPSILLFGDGTVDPVATIRQLASDGKHIPSLHVFLRKSASALRSEIEKSNFPSRKRIPPFSSIVELNEWFAEQPTPDILILVVLLCVAQLGVLLREYETKPVVLEASEERPSWIVALCSGMIPAAAAAGCSNSLDILSLGPEIVRLNLRLMLVLVDRSSAIECSDGTWTIITPGFTAAAHEELIARFAQTELSMPLARQPYISAESEGVTTISGPPSSLVKYFTFSDELQKAKKIPTAINTACHAPHIHFDNIGFIVGDDPLLRSFKVKPNVRFTSIHTGRPIEAPNVASLLLQCVDEVLNHRFRWGTVIDELRKDLKGACQHVNIHTIGPDRVATSLTRILQEDGITSTIAQPSSLQRDSVIPNADDVAIVGMSGRLPGGADDLKKIWQCLREGKDTHTEVPEDRFDLSNHYDATGNIPNTINTPYGCFIDDCGHFDARLFSMSPREARQTCPMQRVALLTTYEALEMAGYSPNTLPSFTDTRIGTFFGQTVDDYRETNACQEVDIYYVSGGVRAFGPGRMNYHFKWEGPSMSVDTACSSSALAIQLAFQSLRSGECDTAVAGGMNIITGTDMYAGLGKGGFLSQTGGCKTLDANADGYCRGEGVGTVVLKRLADATADGDNIIAVIKAAATNHSAYAPSITRPDPGAQIKVMRQILLDAGVDPQEVDYVEMHGTGTQAGDAAEVASISQVFCRNRTEENRLHVGSVKANFGHGEAAAGINSLLKVLLMLSNNEIPPHIGIKTAINPVFTDSGFEKFAINKAAEPLIRSASRPRRIVLNSFNATGGNTALLIEDAPIRDQQLVDPRSHHLLVVTGNTKKAFMSNRKNMLKYIEGNPELHLGSLAYTSAARRMQHKIRAAYEAATIAELVELLAADDKASEAPASCVAGKKIVFTFTGQGSHELSVARSLLKVNPMFKRMLTAYDNICYSHGLPSFMPMLEDPDLEYTQAQFQVSICAIQMGLVGLLRSWGIVPHAVIGHSIGEYAALYTAGVLSKADVLYLVGTRGMLLDKHCKVNEHSMLAVVADTETLETNLARLDSHHCNIACLNGPTSNVVSGPREDLSKLAALLTESNIRSQPVKVEFGFHSEQMRQVAAQLREVSHGISFLKPQIPIASTLLGKVVQVADAFTGDYLMRQTLEPVQFAKALSAIAKHFGEQVSPFWVEIGTHPTCGPMISSTLKTPVDQIHFTLRRAIEPLRSINKLLASAFTFGVNVDWSEYHKEYRHSLALYDLPKYAFDLENFYIPYKNSWRLDKGQASDPAVSQVAPALARQVDPALAPFHFLNSESTGEDIVSVELACDCSEASFLSKVQGHLVEGAGLCPSSVYADLAYHAAAHAWKLSGSSSELPALDLGHMDIISPLKMLSKDDAPELAITAEMELADAQDITVKFATYKEGQEVLHCRCVLNKQDASSWSKEWQESQYLIESRIELFQSFNRPVSMLYTDMIYRLFASAIVAYSKEYQVVEHISIDYERSECVARLKIPESTVHQNGSPGPFCLDALMHTAGFVLNSDPKVATDTCFIASGWSSLRIAEPLRAGATYFCHSRMFQEGQSSVYYGNVTVLQEGRVVGVCRGLKFHRLRRRSLQKLLGVSQTALVNATANIAPAATSLSAKDEPIRGAFRHKQKSSVSAKLSTAMKQESPEVDPTQGVLDDIAAELGVQASELTDSTVLAELGIDSLLSLSLLSRFKKRTGTDLPVDIFSTCHTISELKQHLTIKGRKVSIALPSDSEEKAIRKQDARSTKSAKSNRSDDRSRTSKRSSHSKSERSTRPVKLKSKVLCEIITEEVGLEEAEIRSANTVAELGIDSLLTLSILEKYKRTTGQELSPHVFNEETNMTAIFQKLDGVGRSVETPQSLSDSEPRSDDSSDGQTSATTPEESDEILVPGDITCVSMLLRGDSDSTDPALFLLPDGSGSLFSYIHLPELKTGMRTYAFDSPFHKNPADFNLTFAQVAKVYYDEIRRIQPKGPYQVAGWSLGGVHAYEVSRQLLEAGETVKHLIMMDSPCPGTLPPLPNASLDLLEKAGVFQGLSKSVSQVAQHTRIHFVNITSAFNRWDHRSLTTDERKRLRNATIVWAQYGVLEHDEEAMKAEMPGMSSSDADMMKAKQWLCGKRTCFDDNGWQKLVGNEITCLKVPGNHFSMVFPPVVKELAATLKRVLR